MDFKDTLGKILKPGQIVDIPLHMLPTPVIRAQVVAVNDVSKVIAMGKPTMPPHVILQAVIQLPVTQDGQLPFSYIVHEPEAKPIQESKILSPFDVLDGKAQPQ